MNFFSIVILDLDSHINDSFVIYSIKKGLELRALALNRSFHDHAILQFAKRCIIARTVVRILGNGCRFSRHLFGVYASHGLSLVV